MKMNTQKKALIALIIVAFLGGGTGVFVKIGVQVIPPITFIFLRFLIATAFLIPFISFKKINKDYLLKIIIISLLLIANVLLFAFGVRETTAVLSVILYMFTPILVAMFSYFIFKEKLSKRKTLGLLLGIIGTIFLIGLPVLRKASQFSGTLRGNLLVFSAVISFALYLVLIKKYQQYYSSKFITFIFVSLTTLILFLPAVLDILSMPDWFVQIIPITLISLAFAGIGGGAVMYLMQQYTIKYGSALSASMMTFLQPVAGALMAFILLSERITWNIAIGSLPIFIGAWLVTINKEKDARTS